MRDLVVLLLVYGTLPFIPFRPFLGLCVFAWLAYMRPQDLAWTIGQQRFSYYVMLATFAGLLMSLANSDPAKREKMFRAHPISYLFVALGLWVAITAQTALVPALTRRGAYDYVEFEKTILISLITVAMVGSLGRFRLFTWVVAFSLGVLGMKVGLFGILRGGAELVRGPGGFMSDRNTFALALNMAIPLLFAIGLTERNRWVRIPALVMAPLTAIGVVFTFSRGGLLTMAVVVFLLILRSGRRLLAMLVVVAGVALIDYTAGESFEQDYTYRAMSIGNYEEDSSATERITEWKAAVEIIKDYPVLGIGPHNLPAVHSRYSPNKSYKVTHNSYLQLGIDTGIPGLLLFLSLLVTSLWRLQRVQAGSLDESIRAYARAIQISIVAFICGAMLLNMAYQDLIYTFFAMTACLELIVRSQKQTAPKLVLVEQEEIPWWKRQPAA